MECFDAIVLRPRGVKYKFQFAGPTRSGSCFETCAKGHETTQYNFVHERLSRDELGRACDNG